MRGGARQNAGRPKGGRTRKLADVAIKASQAGISPLEYMLQVMRQPIPRGDDVTPAMQANVISLKLDAAKSAAPFVHPRLSAVDVKTPEPLKFENVDKIDIAKRIAFILTAAMQR